jgi:hypothetical protein
MKLAPFLILALGLAIVGYGLWYQRQHPPRIVSHGTLRVTDPKSDATLTFETRVVEVGAFTKTELRLPSGTWIDCGGDCRDALRRDHLDIWNEMRKRGN